MMTVTDFDFLSFKRMHPHFTYRDIREIIIGEYEVKVDEKPDIVIQLVHTPTQKTQLFRTSQDSFFDSLAHACQLALLKYLG